MTFTYRSIACIWVVDALSTFLLMTGVHSGRYISGMHETTSRQPFSVYSSILRSAYVILHRPSAQKRCERLKNIFGGSTLRFIFRVGQTSPNWVGMTVVCNAVFQLTITCFSVEIITNNSQSCPKLRGPNIHVFGGQILSSGCCPHVSAPIL